MQCEKNPTFQSEKDILEQPLLTHIHDIIVVKPDHVIKKYSLLRLDITDLHLSYLGSSNTYCICTPKFSLQSYH